MDSGFHTFFQVLKLRDCELWRMRNSQIFHKSTGYLQLLYSKDLDLFVLNIGDFIITLDKSLQVICSVGELNAYRSYLIPCLEGFFVIKLVDTNQPIGHQNFETVLSNCCQFCNKSGLEQKLGFQDRSFPPPGFIDKANDWIIKGVAKLGEALTNIKLAGHDFDDLNQRSVKNFDELKDVDDQSNPIVNIPKSELDCMKFEINETTTKYQNTPFWAALKGEDVRLKREDELTDISKLDLGPRIAGTGLTSQSMGEDTGSKPSTYKPVCGDNIDTTWQKHSPDNQEVIGTEGQRLPAYEVQSTKEELKAGFEQASSNMNLQNELVGGSNIDTVEQKSAPDNQEVIGTEGQRLPAYEVESTKGELKEGFNQASTNLTEGTEKPVNVPKTEDTSFTTGLLSEGKPDFGPHEIRKDVKEQKPKEVMNEDDIRPDIYNRPEDETEDISKPKKMSTGEKAGRIEGQNEERVGGKRRGKGLKKKQKNMSPVKEENPETIDV